MRFVIVSGMSGAGKSSALKMLEDAGYFCVDNLPVQLIKNFAAIAYDQATSVDDVAIGIDIRSGDSLDQIDDQLKQLQAAGYEYEIVFLDAGDDILIKRFKETRRRHPLAAGGRIENGIHLEREKIDFLKKKATFIIDTSNLLIRELKTEIDKIFIQNQSYGNFIITIISFGFKYGIPSDSDLVLDVRFLPNPYYISELRSQTGNDQPVFDYVMESDNAHEFLAKLQDMMEFLIPNYINEGKNQLVVSIGCTGGKHRSVTIVNELYNSLGQLPYTVKKEHRDILRDPIKS